jgi:anti-sigma-K factor RskA
MSEVPDHEDASGTRAMLAGEIALGLLDAEQAAEALASDPLLAAEVTVWSERFAVLALDAPAVAPAPRVLSSVLDSISGLVSLESRHSDRNASAAVISKSTSPETQPGFFHNLAMWRGLSAAGLAAAVLLAIAFVSKDTVTSPPLQQKAALPAPGRVLLVSAIMPKDGPPEYVAAYDAERGRLIIVPAATLPARAGVPFLWLVPNDDGEPVALGALDPLGTVSLDLDSTTVKLANEKSGLVITLEPTVVPAGGLAQGPVLAHGKFTSH